MAVWLIFIGCSVAAFWLCWLERETAAAIWDAAKKDGLTGVRRLFARRMKEEAALRLVLAFQFLLMSALALTNSIVYGTSTIRPNPLQVAMRLDLISMPCVVLWKALRNRNASQALSDAALHTDEFETEMHEPYMRALWDRTAILVVAMDSGLILETSHVADRLFGYPSGALLGMKVERLVPEPYRSAHESQRIAFALEPRVSAMRPGLLGRRMDGTSVPLLIQLIPILDNSRVLVLAHEATPEGDLHGAA